MAATAKTLIRQALRQQIHSHALSSSEPCIMSQANLTSLQTRHLSQLISLQNTGIWSFPQSISVQSYKSMMLFPQPQQARGMAEQAAPAKKDKPEQPVVSGKRPAGPVSHMRGGMIKAVFISPNVLMEPYKGPAKPPFLQSWFTLFGWRARKERIMSNIKSMYAIAKLKKNITGFGLRKFKEEALEVYKETCQLLADGDQSRLRQVQLPAESPLPATNLCGLLSKATTPALFGNMKREIKARQDGGWRSVRWSMVKPPRLGQMEIVHGRIMAQNPKDDKTAWVQLTVRIPSEQSFAAYNSKRVLVAGNPDEPIKVVDTWVFERALKKDPSTRWRCAGRLSFQPPPQITAPTSNLPEQQQSATVAPNGQNRVFRQKSVQERSKQRIQAATAAL